MLLAGTDRVKTVVGPKQGRTGLVELVSQIATSESSRVFGSAVVETVDQE